MATALWYGNGLLGQYSATAARRVDWATDTIRTSLHTSSYTPSQDGHTFWSDTTNEITGTGYSTPGLILSGKSTSYNGGANEARLIASNAQWTSSSFTCAYAINYSDTAGASTTDPVLGYVDFAGNEQVTSGTFTITWDATGVLKITAA